jgi:hypothetical protein
MEQAYLALRSHWRSMVDIGLRSKQPFQQDADECMRFFNGPYDFLYGLSEGSQRGDFLYVGMKRLPRPSMVMTVNKVAEGVQLFGPSLYHRNPICKVNPRVPPEIPVEAFGLGDMQNNPQAQQIMQSIQSQMGQMQLRDTVRSILLESYLKYIPTVINLKESSRDAIDEAIIKGMGILWARMEKTAGGRKYPLLEWDTVDNLLIDPDHETLENARWIMRRFVKPVWEVEAERGLPPDTLRGNFESNSMSAAVQAVGNEWKKRTGKTSDLLIYYGIWSKMGMGGLLRGISKTAAEADKYGQYVYVEVCDNYNYFLNVPKEIWGNDEEVRRRVQWETPFWCDVPTSNGWPFTRFAFHKVPRSVWPMSHFRPGLGELKFINWGYSFLVSAIQKRCRDFIAVSKTLDEETKMKILEGNDLELIEISGQLGLPLDQVVSFIRHPDFQDGIFKVIQAVEVNFEKRVGLNELMYGMQQRQDRSATESKSKANFVNIRPDDMANTVEDSMSDAFRKLALMSRWHLNGQDIGAVYGPVIGQLWSEYVETAEIEELIHQLEYRIEAGSTRKPNQLKDSDDADQLMQNLMPILSQVATATGNVDPVNALIQFWGKAHDMDVTKMLLPPPPPPAPPAPDPPKISVSLKGEDVLALGLGPAIQTDFGVPPTQQGTPNPQLQDMLNKQASHEQDMTHADQRHKLAMKQAKEKAASNGSAK